MYQVLSGNRTPIQYSLPYIIDYNDLATLFPTGFDHVGKSSTQVIMFRVVVKRRF